MAFYMLVDYRAPSKERLFLEQGFGARDVKGPYILCQQAVLLVESWALSPVFETLIRLTLGLSSRAPDSATVRMESQWGKGAGVRA